MKVFPTEALTHAPISAVLEVVTENKILYDQIEEVRITTIAKACDILFDPTKYHPESRETADHSLPYCIAVALVEHQVTTRSFSEDKLNDPRIKEVINRIKGIASAEFEAMFPAKQPSKVVILTKDGREYEAYLEYPKGDPREHMSMEDLQHKFNALSASVLSFERQYAIKEMIFGCENYSARDFMNALVVKNIVL